MKLRTMIATAVAACLAISMGIVGTAMAAPAPAKAKTPATAKTQAVWATYYGWYDNTPPGDATAYGSGHAGGTGTYADPITFASDKSEIAVGTIVYYPTVQKYFVMGDDCTECDQDWSGVGPDGGPKMWHFDLWTGGKGGNEMDALDCEDALTLGTSSGAPLDTNFIINPPSTETVSSQPIFDPTTGGCFGGAIASTQTGIYKNDATKTCLSTSGTSVGLAACSTTAAAELFDFNGSFFILNKDCLNTSGSTFEMSSCSGGPLEQWEVNPNGTISNTVSNKCLVTSGSGSSAKVKLSSPNCTAATSADKWAFTETSSTPGKS